MARPLRVGYAGTLLLLVVCGLGAAGAPVPAPPVNLAENATYECVTRPNYWGWKGPRHGDRGQLTDGRIVETWNTEGGPIYSVPSSMGWTTVAPVIVFDLAADRPIGGIGMHTVMSWWGPWWPATVTVLVSDDSETFYLAGPEIKVTPDQLDPPLSEEAVQAGIDRVMQKKGLIPTTHWFRIRSLRAHGRYVALIMSLPPDTGSIVVDEIEIYPGPASALGAERPEQVFSEGRAGWKSHRLYHAMNERLSRDIAALKAKIGAASVAESDRERLLRRLEELGAQRRAMPVPRTEGFRAVLPICPLHGDVFRVQAGLWRAQGAPHLRLWQTHRWDPLGPLEEPRGGRPRVEILMARHAVRSDVLNLSNAGGEPLAVSLTVEGVPGDRLDLAQVPLVDTRRFEPVAAALVPLRAQRGLYRVQVPPGMTRQVWLRCSSNGLDPGRHEGRVRVEAGGELQTVPVSIEVVPVGLPDRLSLLMGGWEYPYPGAYQVTAENIDAFLSVLREYGVNVTWSGEAMPTGTYDAESKLVAQPSRGAMDKWLAGWPRAELYCQVLFGHYPLFPMDDPHRDKKIAAWARDWSACLAERGVKPEKVAILVRDEPTSAKELEKILLTARAIRKGEPGFRIWNDIHFADPTKAPAILEDVMREACDIQCFNLGHYLDHPNTNDAFMEAHAREGRQWWCYNSGDRLADPYVAWLLRPWFCFAKGLASAHWWAFGDGGGGFSWNEYFNTGPTRSPLYLSQDSVVPGKAIEAMREGAQDYELLKMLQARAETGGPEAAEARRILHEGVARVLVSQTNHHKPWSVAKDRSVADQVRSRALRVLARR